MQHRRSRKHLSGQHTNADRRPQVTVILTLLHLLNIGPTRVVGQPLSHPGGHQDLNLNIQLPTMLVNGQNVQNAQLAIGILPQPNRVEEADDRNTRLPGQDRVQKVNCDSSIVFTAQQLFERVINKRDDTDGHVTLPSSQMLHHSVCSAVSFGLTHGYTSIIYCIKRNLRKLADEFRTSGRQCRAPHQNANCPNHRFCRTDLGLKPLLHQFMSIRG